VRAIAELEIPGVEVKDAELKLARQLIEQQSSKAFDPAAYTDAVRERIEAAVEKKVEGQEITLPEAPAGGAQVIDLMEALRLSLEKRGAAAAEAPVAGARKPPKRVAAAHPAGRTAAKK
jgi:DNA end-binding protein Ku